MAKTLNSICFTTLLVVLLFISAEIPKSEALCSKFIGEATLPYPCKEDACEAKCKEHYEHSCRGECEDHDDHDVHEHDHDHKDNEHEHCYCYSRY